MMRSPTPIASAPPDPPSPMTVQTTGVGRVDISKRVPSDRLALAPLFRTYPGIGAGGVG